MVYSLLVCDSVVLVHIINHFFFCPENIPFFTVFRPCISSAFESFLNADANLSFIFYLFSSLKQNLTEVFKKTLNSAKSLKFVTLLKLIFIKIDFCQFKR
jgi:hypothetical protein